MAYYELNDAQDGFKFPLWLSNNPAKVNSLLHSIIDNRIRKKKREGMSSVLVSDAVLSTDPKYKSNITFVDKNRTNLTLKTSYAPNGTIMGAEIVVPFVFRDNNGNKLNIKDFIKDGALDLEKVPQELLETIGFRIPTQGLNSVSKLTIVGFLPPEIENSIIAPADFTVQMGSDFDVDKLYQELNNTYYKDGKLEKLSQKHLDLYNQKQDYLVKLKKIKELKEKVKTLTDESKKKMDKT